MTEVRIGLPVGKPPQVRRQGGKWETIGAMAELVDAGPEEVERALKSHSGVYDAVVVGTPHDRWGQQVNAIVQLRAEATLSASELVEFTAQRIARYKVPKEVRFIDGLPHNATGKVLKHQLPRT